jgi:hypothetical protein
MNPEQQKREIVLTIKRATVGV